MIGSQRRSDGEREDGPGRARLLEAIVQRIPPPKGSADAPLRALVFDCWYDSYRGAVVMARVIEGVLRKGAPRSAFWPRSDYEVEQIGVFSPKPEPIGELGPGEVGFVAANIKSVADAKIGDTIATNRPARDRAFPVSRTVKPMVFAGMYPVGRPAIRRSPRRASPNSR